MDTALDAVLEIFSWIGFGGFVLLALVAVALWAADGTWLPAEAIVDRDGEELVVRWYDADGQARGAVPAAADQAALAGCDTVAIWYRYGRTSRVRLTRRPPGLRQVAWSAAGMLALAVICLVTSWVLLILR